MNNCLHTVPQLPFIKGLNPVLGRRKSCSDHSTVPTLVYPWRGSLQEQGEATAPSASPPTPHKKDPSILTARISPDSVLQSTVLLACIFASLHPKQNHPNPTRLEPDYQRNRKASMPLCALHLGWGGGMSVSLCLLHPSKVLPCDLNSLENGGE